MCVCVCVCVLIFILAYKNNMYSYNSFLQIYYLNWMLYLLYLLPSIKLTDTSFNSLVIMKVSLIHL